MKYKIFIILISGLIFLACINFFDFFYESYLKLFSTSVCQTSPVLPEGKGKLLKLKKNEAKSIANSAFYKEHRILNQNQDISICNTTLFWKVVFEKNKEIYAVDKISGKIIRKVQIPKLNKDNIQNHNSISCEEANKIAKNKFEAKFFSMGYTYEEASVEMNRFYTISCELKDFWLVDYEINFFSVSDLNDENDLNKIPNVNLPSYLIDKNTGEIYLLSNRESGE